MLVSQVVTRRPLSSSSCAFVVCITLLVSCRARAVCLCKSRQMTSSEEKDQQSDLVKNDSNRRRDDSTEITIHTYNVTGMDNSSQHNNGMLQRQEEHHCDMWPSCCLLASKLVKRTNTWSLIISWVILVLLISLSVKCFQIVCICLYLLKVTVTSQLYPLTSSIECAYTSVIISSGHLSHFPCDTRTLHAANSSVPDDDVISQSQVDMFRLIMCTLLPVTALVCGVAIPAIKKMSLTIVCICSSILVTHSICFIFLLVISYNSFHQLPVSTVLSLSLDLCIAFSVLLFLQVHQLHSIMYFKPHMSTHHQQQLDDSHSRLYSIKRIRSVDNVNDKTYHKFEHVDTSLDS